METLSRNFFTISHRKEAVDKGMQNFETWSRVLSRKAVVTDAHLFCRCAKAASSGIEVSHITTADMDSNREMLDTKCQTCMTLRQTQSIDFV